MLPKYLFRSWFGRKNKKMIVVFGFLFCVAIIIVAVVSITFDELVNRLLFVGGNVAIDHVTVPKTGNRCFITVEENVDLDVFISNRSETIDKFVLFVHGNAGTLDGTWCDVAIGMQLELEKMFDDSSVCVVAYDYRGFGMSTRCQSTPENSVSDLTVLSEILCQRFGIQNWDMVYGRSMGAAIAVNWLSNIVPLESSTVPLLLLETPFIGTHSTRFPCIRIIPEIFPCRLALMSLRQKLKGIYVILAGTDLIVDTTIVARFCTSINIPFKIVQSIGHNNVFGDFEWSTWLKSVVVEK
jgi:hypothetical protein